MFRSILLSFDALLAAFIGSLVVQAAEPLAPQPRLAVPENQPSSIERRLTNLENQFTFIIEHLGLRTKASAPNSGPTGPLIETGSTDRLGRLEQGYQEIQRRLQQVQGQLDQPRPTGEPLKPVPAEDVPQGRLVIVNWTGTHQSFSVNGVRHYLAPGQWELMVPYRPVEAYLPGREVPKLFGMSMWRWTGKDYEIRVEIKNQGLSYLRDIAW
jgi:hypothetical protein